MASRDRVRFNVGGQLFETTSTTLANAGRESMLGALLDESWNPGQPEYFLDRNPACFSVLLDLLRTGALHIPANVPQKLLYREALYYGLLDHVRNAKWGPFDGNRLRLADSVPGRAPGDGTAIRAAPDGGCCVAHGSVVHVYNWMLEERKPISLDYQQVNDVGYIDADSIVITARERLGRAEGGMAVFSAATGELQHRFRVEHGRQPKSFTAGALSLAGPDDNRIFSSCKGRLNEYGIGMWDLNTGQQGDFFYELPGCSLGDADILQWLPSKNCLMVATLFPRTDNCFIGLLDFRAKTIPWSWSDAGIVVTLEDKRVLHAIAMEDGHSICVINQYEDLGFIDLRASTGTNSAGAGVRWSSRSKLMNRKVPFEESCYPKLATHNGQLFSCMNDSISVFSGSEHVLTSTLSRSYGGSICDFSIGGDRLFALHNEDNVFDVWESSPSPII